MILKDIRSHAWQLAAEALGRGAIEDVIMTEVPATDPEVVALIMGQQRRGRAVPRSDGEHPYVKRMRRKPPR